MELTGAQALVKSLEMCDVEVMFGLPGGAILPVYDPILDSKIRHVLVRHEQGAGHMAQGYAHVTGKPGVAIVTSGPAATNIVTPLCDAYMDSIPMVAITGQVALGSIGSDAFQECDTTGITMAVTKHNYLVTDPADIPRIVKEAFHIATTGRPGPVLIDVPKDVSNEIMEWYWPDAIDLPGYNPITDVDADKITEAVELIRAAEKPVIYAGGGLLKAHAADALKRFVDLTGIHVATTLMARGVFPDRDPLCLGMTGMHGNYTAVMAFQRSDLLINLGARFDDRVTGNTEFFAPDAKIIHVDIDSSSLGRYFPITIGICADSKTFADGIHVSQASEPMRKILTECLDDLLHVDDETIASAILTYLEKAKLIVEGAGAVPLAVLNQIRDQIKGKKVVLIVSGGNIDVNFLGKIIERGLSRAGRRLRLNVIISDHPGSLSKLTDLIASEGANVIQAIHDRNDPLAQIDQTDVALTLETKGKEHSEQVLSVLKENVVHLERV